MSGAGPVLDASGFVLRSRIFAGDAAETVHLEWHMRHALASLLFEDDDRGDAGGQRGSPVAPARASRRARAKAATRRGDDGLPVHALASLLADLATLTLNEVVPPKQVEGTFLTTVQPTPLQARALGLTAMARRAWLHVDDSPVPEEGLRVNGFRLAVK